MVRLLATILFICCLTAQLNAQSNEQAPKEKEKESAAPAAAATSAKTEFPLEAFQEFSAIMVGSVMMGDERESHIYRSGKLVRTEGLEGRNFLITDVTTQETYGVTALACLHDGHPYFRAAPFASMKPGYKVERATSGQETVDGHSCKIEDVTLSSPKLPHPIRLRLWEAEDLQGFPVKVEFRRDGNHNSVIHYKSVVLGPQDPTLFIYPKDCEPPPKGKQMPTKAPPGARKPAAAPAGTPPQH